jgi:hypothetical protein
VSSVATACHVHSPASKLASCGCWHGDAPTSAFGSAGDRGAFRCCVCSGVPLQRVSATVNGRANCIRKLRHVKNDGIPCVNQIWDKDGHQLVTNEGLLRRTRRCGGRYGESIGLSGVASVFSFLIAQRPLTRKLLKYRGPIEIACTGSATRNSCTQNNPTLRCDHPPSSSIRERRNP